MTRKRIGKLHLGRTPLIVGCVVTPSMLKRMRNVRGNHFDIAEVRLDLIGDVAGWDAACRDIELLGKPVLLTVRSAREGGKWFAPEKARRALIEESLGFVSAVDIELDSRILEPVVDASHKTRRTVIASSHDFAGTPSPARLRKIIARARDKGADVVKIATMIRRKTDVAVLESVLSEKSGGPLCLIGMGTKGVASRVSLACAGSCLTYGYLSRSAAPGQISCRQLSAKLVAAGCRS